MRLAAALLMAVAGASGCAHAVAPTPVPVPTAASEWPTAHAAAMTEARAARLGVADRALTDFAQRFPESPEAAEVPYWRALLKLDPTNVAALKDATALLDAYLAGTPASPHRMEASALRRLIAALDARTAAMTAVQPAVAVPRPDDKAQQEEIARLRDDLAKANAELTRIRRRLAQPKQ
ncbi:MAG: hypothetical protein ABI601_07875 [bacterium]